MASVACTPRSSRFENMMSGAVIARPSANCPTICGVPIFASTTSMAHWAATYAALPARLQDRLCLSFGSLALACITGQDYNRAGLYRTLGRFSEIAEHTLDLPSALGDQPLQYLYVAWHLPKLLPHGVTEIYNLLRELHRRMQIQGLVIGSYYDTIRLHKLFFCQLHRGQVLIRKVGYVRIMVGDLCPCVDEQLQDFQGWTLA